MVFGVQVARARKAVQSAKEELDSLINMCRKQLGMRNLEFMSVSGITHLIEVGQLITFRFILKESNLSSCGLYVNPPMCSFCFLLKKTHPPIRLSLNLLACTFKNGLATF